MQPQAAAAAAAAAEQDGNAPLTPEKRTKKQQRSMAGFPQAANRPAGGVQVLYKSSKSTKAAGPGQRINFLAKHLKMGGLYMRGGLPEGAEDGAAANVRAVETWQSLQVCVCVAFHRVCRVRKQSPNGLHSALTLDHVMDSPQM